MKGLTGGIVDKDMPIESPRRAVQSQPRKRRIASE